MYRKELKINDKNFTFTTLNNYGFNVGVRKWNKLIDKEHFIIKTVHQVFNKDNFSIPHTPIVIDEIINAEKYSRIANLRVLDCPIKFPGNPEYRIPNELRQFDEAIAKVIAYEHAINLNIDSYYAYITIDQGYVHSNDYQRMPGCHVDGFQGIRINPKRPITRSYVAYDRVPTIFYPQAFKTDHLDESKHNFFSSFDEQANENIAITFDRYSIILSNAYTVHRSSKVDYPTYRTFFRLAYDTKIFDRLGNTHNPLFNYNWQMVPRDISNGLYHKKIEKVAI